MLISGDEVDALYRLYEHAYTTPGVDPTPPAPDVLVRAVARSSDDPAMLRAIAMTPSPDQDERRLALLRNPVLPVDVYQRIAHDTAAALMAEKKSTDPDRWGDEPWHGGCSSRLEEAVLTDSRVTSHTINMIMSTCPWDSWRERAYVPLVADPVWRSHVHDHLFTVVTHWMHVAAFRGDALAALVADQVPGPHAARILRHLLDLDGSTPAAAPTPGSGTVSEMITAASERDGDLERFLTAVVVLASRPDLDSDTLRRLAVHRRLTAGMAWLFVSPDRFGYLDDREHVDAGGPLSHPNTPDDVIAGYADDAVAVVAAAARLHGRPDPVTAFGEYTDPSVAAAALVRCLCHPSANPADGPPPDWAVRADETLRARGYPRPSAPASWGEWSVPTRRRRLLNPDATLSNRRPTLNYPGSTADLLADATDLLTGYPPGKQPVTALRAHRLLLLTATAGPDVSVDDGLRLASLLPPPVNSRNRALAAAFTVFTARHLQHLLPGGVTLPPGLEWLVSHLRALVPQPDPLPEPAAEDADLPAAFLASPFLHPETIQTTITRNDPQALRILLRNPTLARADVIRIATTGTAAAKAAVIRGTHDPDVITVAAADLSTSTVRNALLRKTALPPSVVTALAAIPSTATAVAVAQRADLTDAAALTLAEHPDRDVRIALAGNRRLPEPAFEVLAADPDDEVRGAVTRLLVTLAR